MVNLNSKAYSSNPMRPSKHCLYLDGKSSYATPTFAGTFAAKRLIELLVEGIGHSKVSETTMILDNGVTVRCDDLEEILNYKYANDDERNFVLSPQYMDIVKYMRRNTGEEQARPEPAKPAPRRADPPPKPSKPPSAPAQAREPRPDGLVTAVDLSARQGWDPRKARAALRKSGLAKPAHGWAWTEAELPGIIQLVTQHMK